MARVMVVQELKEAAEMRPDLTAGVPALVGEVVA